ncbi:hypothetical protein [Nostoc sp. ATCC 53789]|nr:hypothetical protein [Nostoc sp. ATCC 53789]QHG15710.1 hypothetical protein GJB62_06810 [Nostoc sp. ATCC 53789]
MQFRILIARTNDAFKYDAIASLKILLISPIFSIFLSTICLLTKAL